MQIVANTGLFALEVLKTDFMYKYRRINKQKFVPLDPFLTSCSLVWREKHGLRGEQK